MDPQFAVVLDKTKFPEFVHEEAHARAGRPDHLRKRLLADLGRDQLWAAFLSEVRHQKEKARQAFFARVEQLIDQVLFDPAVAREQVMHESLCEQRLVVQDADHGGLPDPHDCAVRDRHRRRQAQRLPDQASLSEKVPRSEKGDDGFFALLGRHEDLDLAVPDVKDRIGGSPLFEDNLVLSIRRNGPAAIEGGEKRFPVELGFGFGKR